MADHFSLYESMLWEPEAGYFLLKRHLQRLRASARFFGFAFDSVEAERVLGGFAEGLSRRRKVRLTLTADGGLAVVDEDVKPSTPVMLALTSEPVDSTDPYLRHKTSQRQVYERNLAAHPGSTDVLLWNERHEVTETCSANVVLETGGRKVTPPESVGLLPGTFRAQLLEEREIEEAVVHVGELPGFERLYLINSVRRWCDARVVGH